jgi:hypothetical protein
LVKKKVGRIFGDSAHSRETISCCLPNSRSKADMAEPDPAGSDQGTPADAGRITYCPSVFAAAGSLTAW